MLDEIWGPALKDLNKNLSAVYLRKGKPVIDKINLDEKIYYINILPYCKAFVEAVLYKPVLVKTSSFFRKKIIKSLEKEDVKRDACIREMQDDIAVYNYLKDKKEEEDGRVKILLDERKFLLEELKKYDSLLSETIFSLKQEKRFLIALPLERALKKLQREGELNGIQNSR